MWTVFVSPSERNSYKYSTAFFVEVNIVLAFVCLYYDIAVSFWEKECRKHMAVHGQAPLNLTDEW